MPCGWEGNRKSSVALAMRHRLQWYFRIGSRPKERRWAPRLHFIWVWHTLLFLFGPDAMVVFMGQLSERRCVRREEEQMSYTFNQTFRVTLVNLRRRERESELIE